MIGREDALSLKRQCGLLDLSRSSIYEILKLEYPVLWTGMKSFPAEGRGDLCYV